MNARRESWYVYYAAPAAVDAVERVRAMQRELTSAGAVRARLEERVAAEKPTWLEVYEGIADPDAFALRLSAALAANRLRELTGERHIERFRPL